MGITVNNYRLGILGGMGPKATAVFMDQIIEHTAAERDQDHIDMVIVNHATLPDRTTVILEREEQRFLQAIERDFRLLEAADVAHIAIPCNTSHVFYDALQRMTRIPIIHMVDETVKVMADRHGPNAKIGLLATNGTVRSGVYGQICEKYGLQLHVPNEDIQHRIMRLIYHDIKGGLVPDTAVFEQIITGLVHDDGCQGVIIACTELSCIPLGESASRHCVDAMNVLVRQAIERSGKRYI